MAKECKVELKSSDDDIFEVDEILAKVIEYCEYHVNTANTISMQDVKMWEQEFVRDLDQATLCHLILGAQYMEIRNLLYLICQTVAERIKGKSPEEVREIFNIRNDLTPEEEEEIRRENEWAFEEEVQEEVEREG
ncbi:hypothetical protein SUGI_0668570 [Cryptomeria japonica]|nr:hypothetical protein SUGI_0668280 [Cryptomeria japonica]GLJ33222.1 hypothetical protein SUGI_0668570 [Cryptomeria japonica]